MATPIVAQQEASEPDVLHGLILGDARLRSVAGNPAHQVQVLYTQIDRTDDGKPVFRSFEWNVDAKRYFYPASTVKLPAAVLALEKLDQTHRSTPELNRNSTMRTLGLETESLSSIARYIREIFLVSSNAANNRLFELVGPDELSDGLKRRGYGDMRIFHRLAVTREPGPISINAIEFLDGADKIIYRQPPQSFENRWSLRAPLLKGTAHVKDGIHIEEPKDFSNLNGFPLESQQRILRALIFPDSVPQSDRFRLSDDSHEFLLKEMSRWTSESDDPVYDPNRYQDAHTKALFFGFEPKRSQDPDVRMFSKSGMAYGTLTDNSYFADFDNGIEFLLSATVLVNANRTFNDDVYEYDTIGLPFLRDLGRAVHAYEFKRNRKHPPNLAPLKFEYRPEL